MEHKFKLFLAIAVALVVLSFSFKSLDTDYNISEKIAEKFSNNNTTGYATLTAQGISDVQNTEEISYVYGNGLVAQVKNGVVEYYHNDYLGSPTVISDSSGNKLSEQKYDVFGNNLNPEISTLEFTGKEKDDDTGLHYFNARYYDSSTGKFTTPDTVKPKLTNPQSLNLYTYTLNNPLKYIDPSGNQEKEKKKDNNEEKEKIKFNNDASYVGFIGNYNSLEELIAADTKELERIGGSFEEIADRIKEILDYIKNKDGYGPNYRDVDKNFFDPIIIKIFVQSRGLQLCPFEGCGEGWNEVVRIKNSKTGEKLTINKGIEHLAREHHLLEKGNEYEIIPEKFYKHLMPSR